MILGTILLFTTSIIWGSALLFQKLAMENLAPFYFNGLKFLLGAIILFPLVFFQFLKKNKKEKKTSIFYGAILGFVLFLASCLQQVGIFYTNINKAAFITGLYICFVPLLNFFGEKTKPHQYFGILIAIIGFYVLTIKNTLTLEFADSILLLGSICWALHIILVDNFIKKIDAILLLAFIQFFFTAIFSLTIAIVFEKIELVNLQATTTELFFSGLLSTAIAYSLQIKAQKLTAPVYASLIFSTEAVFASIFAYLFLAEQITRREFLGSFLLFIAIIFCQISPTKIIFFLKKKIR